MRPSLHPSLHPSPQPLISDMPDTISVMMDKSNEELKEKVEASEKNAIKLTEKLVKLDKVKG